MFSTLLLSSVASGIPRAHVQPSRALADATLNMGLTSVRFKQDILDLFRADRFAASTALDIGTGHGSTAAALAVNFGIVLATETHWDLDRLGGFILDRSKLLRGDGRSLNNIVSIHLDASTPYSFGIFATQNISACVIDAQHDFEHICRETFAVLRQIPCCVETIVYHDYCDAAVFQAVQYFVLAGLLAFRTSIGTPNWDPVWCRDGRPEGAAMRVLRHSEGFHDRLEALYQHFVSPIRLADPLTQGFQVKERLNGTTWLLLHTAQKQLSLLHLAFHPAASSLVTPVLLPTRSGEDWKLEAVLSLGSARVHDKPSHRNLLLVVIPISDDPESFAWAELDRDFGLMHLRIERGGEAWECIGFQQEGWSMELQKIMDNFLHIDASLNRAAGGSFFQLKDGVEPLETSRLDDG